jgi:hypothetical protein
MKCLSASVRSFCPTRAACKCACLGALAIGLLLTGCPSQPAPPPDMNSLRQLLESQYYHPQTYVTQGAGGRVVLLWASGAETEETWNDLQRRLEDFESCRSELWTGSIAVVDISTPSWATATVWWPQSEDLVDRREVRLRWDGSQWKVLSDKLLNPITCMPPIAP